MCPNSTNSTTWYYKRYSGWRLQSLWQVAVGGMMVMTVILPIVGMQVAYDTRVSEQNKFNRKKENERMLQILSNIESRGEDGPSMQKDLYEFMIEYRPKIEAVKVKRAALKESINKANDKTS